MNMKHIYNEVEFIMINIVVHFVRIHFGDSCIFLVTLCKFALLSSFCHKFMMDIKKRQQNGDRIQATKEQVRLAQLTQTKDGGVRDDSQMQKLIKRVSFISSYILLLTRSYLGY